MNIKILSSLFFLAVSSVMIALGLFTDSQGPHGGIVKKVDGRFIEIKNNSTGFYTFLLDKNEKPTNNTGTSCKLKIVFPDNTSTHRTMNLFQEDGFSTEPLPVYFSYCIITFNVSNRIYSTEFDNDFLYVQKKSQP